MSETLPDNLHRLLERYGYEDFTLGPALEAALVAHIAQQVQVERERCLTVVIDFGKGTPNARAKGAVSQALNAICWRLAHPEALGLVFPQDQGEPRP